MEKKDQKYPNGLGGAIDYVSEDLADFISLNLEPLETFLGMLATNDEGEVDNRCEAQVGEILLESIEKRFMKVQELLESRFGKIQIDRGHGTCDGEILGLTITPDEKKNGK